MIVIFVVVVCTLRVLTFKEQTIPKNGDIRFEATILQSVKTSQNNQVVKISEAQIYMPLYPKYEVGDRIKVSGFADDKGRMFGANVQKIGTRPVFLEFVSKLRERVATNIGQMLSGDAATLVLGTVLGVDTISEDFKEALIKTGTIHVVVVSGQNLMIVVGVVMALGRYVGRRKCLAISVLCVFLYSLLAGFEPPVLRASLVVLFTTVAIYFGREVSSVWSLFLAGILIVLAWPSAIFEISFQLTFAASLGIITLGLKLSKLFSRVPIVGENGAVAISAFLFTMPVVVYYFGRVSILSPVVNILVAEAVLPIMLFGFLISVASLIFMPLARLLAIFVYPAAFYFVQIVWAFAKIDFGQIYGGKENLFFVVIAYLLIFAALFLLKAK